ncbi:MAG: DNA polymerase II [Thermoprotei archaeon]
MGRTQPSLSRSVEGEVEKLTRIARKLRDEGLRKELESVLPIIRQVEEAFEDELADPLEVLLVALLVRCSKSVPG